MFTHPKFLFRDLQFNSPERAQFNHGRRNRPPEDRKTAKNRYTPTPLPPEITRFYGHQHPLCPLQSILYQGAYVYQPVNINPEKSPLFAAFRVKKSPKTAISSPKTTLFAGLRARCEAGSPSTHFANPVSLHQHPTIRGRVFSQQTHPNAMHLASSSCAKEPHLCRNPLRTCHSERPCAQPCCLQPSFWS